MLRRIGLLATLFGAPAPVLFFTGKGGVGKTSTACAVAIGLADRGLRVLLVSTDPASNLDEVLGVAVSTDVPTPVLPGLEALNIDPEAAARAYRERVVGPYRGVLPDSAVASIEEQLSGGCTVELAAFDQFAKLLGEPGATSSYDHVVFDTAPTGHTLRLLELPAAWTGFFETNTTGNSCLGPLSGLEAERQTYSAALAALRDGERTQLLLVTRPEEAAIAEAARTHTELRALGIDNQALIVNGVFRAADPDDPIAAALEERAVAALDSLPASLAALQRQTIPLSARAPMGAEGLREFLDPTSQPRESAPCADPAPGIDLEALVDTLEPSGRGVILTMGKGGVGKTTVALAIAQELARRGHPVHLTTTDPAGQIAVAGPGLTVDRIDPELEVERYTEQILATAGAGLDERGIALLTEELRSPCTMEIAVFQAFARQVAAGDESFVVIDTAPTGHTLLLLDAAEAYHREVLRKPGAASAVRSLLPRLRDPEITRVLLVTLPEATPVHEARHLEDDLVRAGIHPYAWVVNQALSPLVLRDPVLQARRAAQGRYVDEVAIHAERMVVLPWQYVAG